MNRKLYTVEVIFAQPVFAESEEEAIEIAKNDSWDFLNNGEYTAYQSICKPWNFPDDCLVFHSGKEDITVKMAFEEYQKTSEMEE